MTSIALGFLSPLLKMRTRTRGKKITASPHAYCVGVLFLQGGMIGYRYLGGGKSLVT